MHRMKIGLAAAVLLIAATVVFYAMVTSKLDASVHRNVEEKVARAQRVYQHISRLGGIDFANLAAEKARNPKLVAVAERPDEMGRRQAAFEECEALNASLRKQSRQADILAFLDSTGKVLARDLNPNANYGEDLRAKFPAVAQALKGQPVKDVWTWGNRIHDVALAPIAKPDGTIVGALLIGYVLSAKTAQSNRDLLGTEIAYFHDGKVHTSSFESAEADGKEDVGKTQAMSTLLFQSGGRLALDALARGELTPVWHHEIDGEDYVVVAAPLPGNFADKTSGAALLASTTDGLRRARRAGAVVVIFGLVAILVTLGAAVLTARRFIAPLDSIEIGIAEVINGNIDYTFKPVGPDFDGLANSLNVMLARLLGRDEPSEDQVEEEDETPKWKAEQMIFEAGDGASAAAGGLAAGGLAQESEASYYPRLFGEYVNALRGLGKPIEGMSVQSFMAKLHLAEAGLEEKWDCKLVRFQVAVRGDQVVFCPIRLA